MDLKRSTIVQQDQQLTVSLANDVVILDSTRSLLAVFCKKLTEKANKRCWSTT